jgi:hypothetical protein
MTNLDAPITNSNPAVPLARARDGSPLALPEGGVAWRVRRHTGGRPQRAVGMKTVGNVAVHTGQGRSSGLLLDACVVSDVRECALSS